MSKDPNQTIAYLEMKVQILLGTLECVYLLGNSQFGSGEKYANFSRGTIDMLKKTLDECKREVPA